MGNREIWRKTIVFEFCLEISKEYWAKDFYLEKEISNIEESASKNIDMLRKRDLETELSELLNYVIISLKEHKFVQRLDGLKR